jgi:hypothetical protein
MPATAPSDITYKPEKHAAEAKFVSLHRSLFNVFIFVPFVVANRGAASDATCRGDIAVNPVFATYD